MNSTKKISYYFRRYSAVRFICILLVIALIVGISFLISYHSKVVPEITSINPPVGVPGDVIVINGKNFGKERDMNYVEFSGSKLTSSAYISWSDTKIKLVLPANVQDGLVVVGNKNIRSKPALFANEIDIPVLVPTVKQTTKPVITAITGKLHYRGDLLTITGNNFGDTRGDSKVYFTIDYDDKIKNAEIVTSNMYTENMVPVSEFEAGYEFWSNTEIKVRIPDGASSGLVQIQVGDEKSEGYECEISSYGSSSVKLRRIYLMEYSADIADLYTNDISTVTLRCPIPLETYYQPEVQITEINPNPVLTNYQNAIIHQLSKSKNYFPKTVFKQTFVLPVYERLSSVNADKTVNYKKGDIPFVDKALESDSLIPSENEEVKKLAAEITGKEKNNYKKAKLIYDYFCDKFKINSKVRKNDADPLDLIKSKKGDSYDFAIMYTALLRAAGVPCLTNSGVLVLQDLTTQPHWWCEFYLPGFGWLPVDPAIGAGLEYKSWTDGGKSVDSRDFYFGNMDSHHILFSRGWAELKPFSQENKIVQHPRSFALQAIWEEASESTVKYSSYWSVPIIRGVY